MMKYRSHSLRYTKRPLATKPERPVQPPATIVTAPTPDKPVGVRSVLDEPLINVHDKSSKYEDLTELLGLIALHARTATVPILRRIVMSAKPRIRNGVLSTAKKARSTSRSSYMTKSTLKKVIYLLVILAVLVVLWQRLSPKTSSPENLTIDQKIGSQAPVGGTTPDFETLLPEGKTIESLGGWTRVSPPDRNPVFAFVDTVGQDKITVSQQPLPSGFSNNPDKDVKELALNFNAKERVVADDATIYFIGTSAKGPQSVILAKQNNLILIKSSVKINNKTWSAYIATLK